MQYICIFFFIIFACQGCGTSQESQVRIYNTCIPVVQEYPFSAVVYGDTRSIHTLEVWRDNSNALRPVIANKIASETPALIIHTGDIVLKGSSKSDWTDFDTINTEILKKNIPFFPCLGNHDYSGRDEKALSNYFDRFPGLFAQHWYSLKVLGILFVILDTNDDELAEYQKKGQLLWFESQLLQAQNDPNTHAVLVFNHHPPYSNIGHGNHVWTSTKVVPIMKKYSKVKMLASAHCHTYEKFYEDSIYFIVSGGGGAPLMAYTKPDNPVHKDCYDGPREHHYCHLTFLEDHIEISIRMLHRSTMEWSEVDKFSIAYK